MLIFDYPKSRIKKRCITIAVSTWLIVAAHAYAWSRAARMCVCARMSERAFKNEQKPTQIRLFSSLYTSIYSKCSYIISIIVPCQLSADSARHIHTHTRTASQLVHTRERYDALKFNVIGETTANTQA